MQGPPGFEMLDQSNSSFGRNDLERLLISLLSTEQDFNVIFDKKMRSYDVLYYINRELHVECFNANTGDWVVAH
jgi:hypothetical protein